MWPRRAKLLEVLLAPALVLSAAAARPTTSQASQPGQTPVFGTAVELVRLDVVVLDREGRPVTGLTKDDFTVEEEGRPQAITSFEPVVVRGARPVAAEEPPRLAAARLRAPSEGRCLLVYFDDIHVRNDSIERVRQALRRTLERDLRDGDWVTIIAPEQNVWWTARNAWEYRQLARVVERLKGQGAGNSYSDWELMRALEYGLAGFGQRAVVAGGGALPIGPNQDDPVAGVGKPDLSFLGEEVVALIKRRTGMTLDGLRQGLEALVALRGHKSLLLVSEGFLLLPKMPGYDELLDGARRANVAIHFLDPRGLEVGLPGASATASEGPPPAAGPGPGMQLAMVTGEAEGIAEVTGGHAFGGVDAAGAIQRVLAESGAYYLLGYSPQAGATGQRKVKVRVRGNGLKVLARTRYFASDATGAASAPTRPARSGRGGAADGPARIAMRSLADSTDLPLRVETLFFEPNHKGEVATMLAAEVVPPPGPSGQRLFQLVSEARALDGTAPVHDQFEGSPQVTPGVPVILARQWNLTPGVWQLRLLVEDTVTKRMGTLVHTFEVPDPKRFRISTPILTAEIEDPNGKRKPRVALGRTFHTGSVLYCQYSAYGAPAAGKHDWVPHVFGSWTLRRGDETVRESAPTLIQPAPDGRVTRTLGIGLQGLATGEYLLVLNVRDETTGQAIARAEAFTVAP